ncbi:hypothetical protein Q8A73_008652 [Channa argus]|nr:hypothetical protein Q8A73_008652 [Channa argus]
MGDSNWSKGTDYKVVGTATSSEDPVHVKINAEEGPHTVASTAKALDLDALKKPWRRAGANISDYFNYGFDEKSWNAYCKKQTKLRAANKKLCAKIRKRHDRHGEEQLCWTGSSSILASRKSTASADVTKEGSQSSRKVEGSQYLSDQGDSTQVITEMSPQEDTRPPSFLYRREPNRHSPSTALDSGHAKKFKASSTSHQPFPSGVSSLIPRTTASKSFKSFVWQKKGDTERGRSREHGNDKNRKRGRSRETESYFSHNRGEKRMRYRQTAERGNRTHNFQRDSGEQEWHRDRRRTSEGRQKSSCSSSSSSRRSRKDDGEDRKRKGGRDKDQ